jgi:hypothetical protein
MYFAFAFWSAWCTFVSVKPSEKYHSSAITFLTLTNFVGKIYSLPQLILVCIALRNLSAISVAAATAASSVISVMCWP